MERVLGDMLLPASIRDFVPRLENRCKDFLVSGLLRALILKFKPRLENRCKLFPVYTLLRALILNLRGSIWESLQGFPTELVVSTMSASDSNFRCGKEEWPACSGSRDDDPPRPILIFVAADKRSRNEIRENRDKPFRPIPIFSHLTPNFPRCGNPI